MMTVIMKNMIGMMTMKEFPNDKVKMLQFPGLNGDCNISHFITTRHGGVSKGNYASFNPGEFSGDDTEAVRLNRELLSAAIGIPPENIYAPYQIHEAGIFAIEEPFLDFSLEEQRRCLNGIDAVVTDVAGICIAVSTADCVPVLLYAPDKKVVAAVHAGWRGTVKQIVLKTIRFIANKYAVDPIHIKAGIGPSISREAFEVGEEVVRAFVEAGVSLSDSMVRNERTGKAHIDLWEVNRVQLLQAGLLPENIEIAGICTYAEHKDFFSARRLGIKSGRIMSGIIKK